MDFKKAIIDLFRNTISSAIGSMIWNVVSVLVLIIVGWVMIEGGNVLTKCVPELYLLVPIVICMIICLGVLIHSHKKIKSQQRVFVISCSFTTNPFFAELIRSLLAKIESQHFIPEIRFSLKDFQISEISRHIDFVGKNKDLYIGGFIIHAESDAYTDICRKFAKNFGKPVVFLDSCKSENKESFPKNASFIGYDGEEIGRIAAGHVISVLQQNEIRTPEIMVIAGKLQTQRQACFIEAINRSYHDAHITTYDSCDFNRKSAETLVRDNLESKLEGNEPMWDVIFCTNDEMALGTWQAIKKLNNDKLSNIAIVGVDAIDEAKEKVDGGDINFINTIIQNPEALAEEGINEFVRRIHKDTPQRIICLEPKLYKNRI